MLGDTVQDFSVWMDLDVSRSISRVWAVRRGKARPVLRHARWTIAGIHLDGISPEHRDKRMMCGEGELEAVRSVQIDDTPIIAKEALEWEGYVGLASAARVLSASGSSCAGTKRIFWILGPSAPADLELSSSRR